MTVTIADTPHAILSTEEVTRLRSLMGSTPNQCFEHVADLTELPAELLRKLVRDKIIPGSAPYRVTGIVGWCDIDVARQIAHQLAAARRPVEGVGITVAAAAVKYNFHRSTIYRWQYDGWVKEIGRDSLNDQLLNEGDIAVARALADLSGHIAGKPVFPQTRRK